MGATNPREIETHLEAWPHRTHLVLIRKRAERGRAGVEKGPLMVQSWSRGKSSCYRQNQKSHQDSSLIFPLRNKSHKPLGKGQQIPSPSDHRQRHIKVSEKNRIKTTTTGEEVERSPRVIPVEIP